MPSLVHARFIVLTALVASCGGDGRNAPAFSEQAPNPFDVAGNGPSASAPAPPASPRPVNKTYRGAYLRATDTSAFKPCGTSEYLPVVGAPRAVANLREQFLYHLPSMGRPLLAVFRGYPRADTVRRAPGDTGSTPLVVRRFFLAAVDTLRVWDGDECARSRLPP